MDLNRAHPVRICAPGPRRGIATSAGRGHSTDPATALQARNGARTALRLHCPYSHRHRRPHSHRAHPHRCRPNSHLVCSHRCPHHSRGRRPVPRRPTVRLAFRWHAAVPRCHGAPKQRGWGVLDVEYAEQRRKYGIPCTCCLFCEYTNLEYVRVPVIYRVHQAEHAIQILVAASQEYVNTYSTCRVGVRVAYL